MTLLEEMNEGGHTGLGVAVPGVPGPEADPQGIAAVGAREKANDPILALGAEVSLTAGETGIVMDKEAVLGVPAQLQNA